MTKMEKCIELAEDYADRAASKGCDYDDSYEQYLIRCINREEENVSKQWGVVFRIKPNKPIFNFV